MSEDMKAIIGAIIAAPILYVLLWVAMAIF